jgi:hypothetical protein
MKITEIMLHGKMDPKTDRPIATATLRTDYTGKLLVVTIDTGSPLIPDIREHKVETDNEDDMFSMAECLHFQLEGRKGSNSEIHDYYRLLQYFEQ